MNTLNLPDLRREKVVLFHIQYPDSSTDVVLQILPKEKGKPSNTFYLDLEKGEVQGWFRALPGHKEIKTILGLYGHAAYYPSSGNVKAIEDRELQNSTLIEATLAGATAERSGKNLLGKWDSVVPGARRTRRTPFGDR